MRSWYLIYTKPQQEGVAMENLLRQGYEIYLPRLRQRRRRHGRVLDAVVPMFPRYMFINLNDTTDNWKPIRSTLGVSRIVRFGELPARIPDALIDALRASEGPEGIHEPSHLHLRRGDPVQIVDGVLAGYEAVYESASSRERVTLLLKIAGRQVSVQVHERDISPL
jgi:transcriptional antiterminator RfaH